MNSMDLLIVRFVTKFELVFTQVFERSHQTIVERKLRPAAAFVVGCDGDSKKKSIVFRVSKSRFRTGRQLFVIIALGIFMIFLPVLRFTVVVAVKHERAFEASDELWSKQDIKS